MKESTGHGATRVSPAGVQGEKFMPRCVFCNTSVSAGSQSCPKCGAALRLDDEPVRGPAGAFQPDDLLALVRDGRTIEAIKEYREQTGVGLKEAKGAIEMLVATGRLPATAAQPAPAAIGDEFEARLVELVRTGRKIEAIKEFRQRTGAGLKEAKEAVEALAARHGIVPTSGGCAGMILVLALSGLFAIWAVA
jgi:ribosomal protein L7/L12